MTTKQVADRLVELCRKGDFETAQKELYADDASSEEPGDSPLPKVQGRDAIVKKGHEFQTMVEQVYGIEVSEPIVAGNAFACTLIMDVKMKDQPRGPMAEICTYTVKDGKITAEQFTW